MSINCPDCNKELDEIIDTTYSNYNSGRCLHGQHTGDIYYCDVCEQTYIDDFVNNCVRYWSGE